jgi:hypothetical protein
MANDYNYPFSLHSDLTGGGLDALIQNDPAAADAIGKAVFAKRGAIKKRALNDMISEEYRPEDFGAKGDGLSHTLTSLGYATLAAAQVDYPAAISLADEADWCAIRQMIEQSGGRRFFFPGQYVVPNPDLNHVIRGQSDQYLRFGGSSKWTANTWSFPSIAWCEKTGVVVDGINWYSTGVFVSTGSQGAPWTPAQFNSIVGPVLVTGQSYRNISGCLSINGTENIVIRNFTIQHATPGRRNCVFMGISLNQHTDGRPANDIVIEAGVIDDCHFGIFGVAHKPVIRRITSNRYEQLPIDAWAAAHLMYLSTYVSNGSGTSQALIEDVIDYGEFLATDSAAITVDTTADTITFDWGLEAVPSNLLEPGVVMFVGDVPPAPLVMGRPYFIKALDLPNKTLQVTALRAVTVPPNTQPTIDLTGPPGPNCRMIVEASTQSVGSRYINGLELRNIRSYRPHGMLILHNTKNVKGSDLTHISDTCRGTLVSGSAQGGVFDSGVPVAGAGAGLVDQVIRLVSGLGAGQTRRIIQQTYGTGGSPAANAFTVDRPWDTVPNNTTLYETNWGYIGATAAIYGVTAFNAMTYDYVVLDRVSISGEFWDKSAVSMQSYAPDAVTLLGRKLILTNFDVDIDMSKQPVSSAFALGSVEMILQGRLTQRNAPPFGDKAFLFVQQATTGIIDLTLMGPSVSARFLPSANTDLIIRLRDRVGKPWSYPSIWANQATTKGVKFLSEAI